MYKNSNMFSGRLNFNKAKQHSKKSLWFDKNSERHIQIMALMLFLGFFAIIFYGFKTIISWRIVSWIYIGFAVVFSQIPNRWLPVVYRIRKEMRVMLVVFALSPLFTGLFLVINYYFSSHKIEQTILVVNYSYYDNTIEVELDDEELNKHIEIRRFQHNKFDFKPAYAVYTIGEGVFGFNVITNAYLKP